MGGSAKRPLSEELDQRQMPLVAVLQREVGKDPAFPCASAVMEGVRGCGSEAAAQRQAGNAQSGR